MLTIFFQLISLSSAITTIFSPVNLFFVEIRSCSVRCDTLRRHVDSEGSFSPLFSKSCLGSGLFSLYKGKLADKKAATISST